MKRGVLLVAAVFSLFVLILAVWGSDDPVLNIRVVSVVPNQAWVDLEALRTIRLNQLSLAVNWRDFEKITLFNGKELLAVSVISKGRVVFNFKSPLVLARGMKRFEAVGDNLTADLKISFVEALIIDDGRSVICVLDLTSTDIPQKRGLTSWGAIKSSD